MFTGLDTPGTPSSPSSLYGLVSLLGDYVAPIVGIILAAVVDDSSLLAAIVDKGDLLGTGGGGSGGTGGSGGIGTDVPLTPQQQYQLALQQAMLAQQQAETPETMVDGLSVDYARVLTPGNPSGFGF